MANMGAAEKKKKEMEIEPRSSNRHIPYFRMVFHQGAITDEILESDYPGSGTDSDPFIVSWIEDDPGNPQNFRLWKKWFITMLVALATLAVAFVSSAYSGGVSEIIREFNTSSEVATLGISLFVLGFALGPLLWAPLSELYGRQVLLFGTYAMLTAFNAGAAGSRNIQTLIILRFFAGSFGSSPLTNAGGVVADLFSAEQRGMAMSIFAAAPFLGPVLGPIVGGFVGETIGWRWVEGIMAIFTGTLWILCAFLVPETYAPVLLRARAKRLSEATGKVYLSKPDSETGKVSLADSFKTNLSRPWILLFREPIVLLLSLYMAIIYGTLYMLFSAFPVVYQQQRGWSPGIGGLAFIGVAVGMIGAVSYSLWDNTRYVKTARASPNGIAPPEARLPPCMVGGIAIPVGLFWFAWTNSPSIHWIVSIIATAPFGFGMVLVFLTVMNYLIDAYLIYAASVLAASSVIRSIFGAVFPLFTTYMYDGLGIHWASSIPAFLALICVPFPFIFYKYGPAIRSRCKFAAEAAEFLKKLQGGGAGGGAGAGAGAGAGSAPAGKADRTDSAGLSSSASRNGPSDYEETGSEKEEEREAFEEGEEDEDDVGSDTEKRGSAVTRRRSRKVEPVKSAPEQAAQRKERVYEGNPFDLDRVNTRESFTTPSRSRASSRSQR